MRKAINQMLMGTGRNGCRPYTSTCLQSSEGGGLQGALDAIRTMGAMRILGATTFWEIDLMTVTPGASMNCAGRQKDVHGDYGNYCTWVRIACAMAGIGPNACCRHVSRLK